MSAVDTDEVYFSWGDMANPNAPNTSDRFWNKLTVLCPHTERFGCSEKPLCQEQLSTFPSKENVWPSANTHVNHHVIHKPNTLSVLGPSVLHA